MSDDKTVTDVFGYHWHYLGIFGGSYAMQFGQPTRDVAVLCFNAAGYYDHTH